MQFRVYINTTGSSSFRIGKSEIPAWYNVFEADFELPFHWSRDECLDSLVKYFESIEIVPYQNLAGYEQGMADTEVAFDLMMGKLVYMKDSSKKIEANITKTSMDGSVIINIQEVDYV